MEGTSGTSIDPGAAAGVKAKRGRGELTQRIVVGAALIVLALGDIWLGGVYFWALIALASLLMMGEWTNLVRAGRARRRAQFVILIPLIALVPQEPFPGPTQLTLAIFLFSAAALGIIARSRSLAGGLLYVGLPALALVYLRELDFGHLIAMWTLALVWATDIGAFFVGRAVGGPKLAPAVSPNKTWAGLIGGMGCALICGLALWSLDRLPLAMALFSAVLALVAQMGDLFESWLKRRAGVKDSGRLLPGHGGVLDRLDGLVPVAPLVALMAIGGFVPARFLG